ncbi:MAG TPA: hypothetical protein VLV87_06250 [Gammaproteobacteria bacterium]|nr:hypothetical protein [Gammaproteobacteria bacterium]
MRYVCAALSGLLLGIASIAATAQPPSPSPANATSDVPNQTAAPNAPTHCPPTPAGTSPRSRSPDSATATRTPPAPKYANKPTPGERESSPCR